MSVTSLKLLRIFQENTAKVQTLTLDIHQVSGTGFVVCGNSSVLDLDGHIGRLRKRLFR